MSFDGEPSLFLRPVRFCSNLSVDAFKHAEVVVSQCIWLLLLLCSKSGKPPAGARGSGHQE